MAACSVLSELWPVYAPCMEWFTELSMQRARAVGAGAPAELSAAPTGRARSRMHPSSLGSDPFTPTAFLSAGVLPLLLDARDPGGAAGAQGLAVHQGHLREDGHPHW